MRLLVLPEVAAPNAAHDPRRAPTARELMRMPTAERNRIMEHQAVLAEHLYTTVPELTDFAAFGEEELFDETPSR